MKVTTQTTSTVKVCIRSRSIKTLQMMRFTRIIKSRKQNKKEDWSDKALEDFLETVREQPVKEMNDRRNKWIIFSKHLERNQKKGMMRSHSRNGRKAWHSHIS